MSCLLSLMLQSLYYILFMNNQSQTWNLILQKQRMADLQRQKEEKEMKNYLRAQYKHELQTQINSDRIARQRSLQQQKLRDRLRMDQSEENYHKYVQLWNKDNKGVKPTPKPSIVPTHNPQKLKQAIDAYLSKDNSARLDHRSSYPRIEPITIFANKNNESDGSETSIRRNHSEVNISSSRTKKTDYLKKANLIHNYEDQYKKVKDSLTQEYGGDLKRQILQNQSLKMQGRKINQLHDSDNMRNYQNYYVSLDLQRRQQKKQNEEELRKILEKQVDQRKTKLKNEQWMPKREGLLNKRVIQETNDLIIPGETFMLDPHRRKQLETVAKSISPKKNLDQGNYLASRGKNLLN